LFSLFCFFLKNIVFGQISPGAEQLNKYIPLLEGKRVGVVTNHTGLVSGVHLVDTLITLGVDIKAIFCPEHGFRGIADAGEIIENSRDSITGIPIYSLYGSRKKPQKKDIANIDLFLFDLQDVGVRFYTYISTLHYIMEAAAETQKKVILLDRPNPNGFYIDGPVLDTACRSFVGMHPIPVVYGMTIGELGRMINGERWLDSRIACQLEVIPCLNYTHSSKYQLPVPPSPNLPNMAAVYLYPSLGFFEGTVVSAGRGTLYPFQIYGHPLYKNHPFVFTPIARPGAKSPKFKNVQCLGENLQNTSIAKGESTEITFFYLINAHENLDVPKFFNSYFRLLIGNETFQKQIEENVPMEEIRKSWTPLIDEFKTKRALYLLYP